MTAVALPGRVRVASLVALACLASYPVGTAHAKDPPVARAGAAAGAKPHGDADAELEVLVTEADIRKKWDEGIALAKRQDFVGASEAFRLAYAWSKEPRMLLNLGLAEMKAGRNGSALRHFREYVRDPHASPEKVEAITRDAIAPLIAKTGHITLDAPNSAEVVVDGDIVAHSGDEVDVDPGEHEVVSMAAHGGTALARSTVRVGAGESVSVRVAAAPVVPDVTPASPVSEGARAQATRERAPSETPSRARTWSVVALGAGTVAAAGLGIYFTVRSTAAKSQVDELRESLGARPGACTNNPSFECAKLEDEVQTWLGTRTAAYVSFGIAGGLAATTAATWLFWPKSSRGGSTAWVVPSIGQSRGGVVLGGTF